MFERVESRKCCAILLTVPRRKARGRLRRLSHGSTECHNNDRSRVSREIDFLELCGDEVDPFVGLR